VRAKKGFFMLICFFLITISNELAYSNPSLRVPLITKNRYDEAFKNTGGKIFNTMLKVDFYVSATTHMVEDLLYLAKELAKNGLIYLSELIMGIIDKAGRDEYEISLTETKEEMHKLLSSIKNIGFVQTTRYDFSLLNEKDKKTMREAILKDQDTEVLNVRYKGLLNNNSAKNRRNL